MTKDCSIINDIVHQEAFKVLKTDVLKILENSKNLPELSMALGLNCTLNQFIEKDDYRRLGIIMKANDTKTKSEEIQMLLKNSKDLNEYILLTYLTQEMKNKGVITTVKKV